MMHCPTSRKLTFSVLLALVFVVGVEAIAVELVAFVAPLTVVVAVLGNKAVLGTSELLTSGRILEMLHTCPLLGHISVRFKSLSSGPVGPDS